MAITAMGLGTKAAPEGANLDPQREFWSWLRAFLHPGEYGDNHAHERAYFSGFACTQTDPAGMSIRIGGTSTPDSAVLVVAPVGKPVLLSTNGEPELVTIPTAPATGSRIDAVVSYIDTTSPVTDSETPGTPEYVHTIVVQGTAASNPSELTNEQIVAALPAGAGGTYYRWCDVKVAASQTVITNSDIIDKKPASPNVYLTDGSITTAKLANRAVTSDKIDWTTLKGAPILRNIAVSDDTPNGWRSVMKGLSGQEAGRATIWYTETGKFSTQPSQYGFCEVIWADGSDVALVWHQQQNGDWFWRSGNASGWAAAWRNGVNDLYFRPGETITVEMRGFGYVTTGAKDIFLTFPMGGKSLALINSVIINSGNMSIRCDNKYALSDEPIRNYATSLNVSPNLGALTLHITKSSGFGVTNNSAVAAQGTLSITFNG